MLTVQYQFLETEPELGEQVQGLLFLFFAVPQGIRGTFLWERISGHGGGLIGFAVRLFTIENFNGISGTEEECDFFRCIEREFLGGQFCVGS